MASSIIPYNPPVTKIDTSIEGMRCYRTGNVVTINYNNSAGLTADGITIPQEFRPPIALVFTGKAYRSGVGDIWYQPFRITSAGKFVARSDDNNSDIAVTWVTVAVTYVVT